MNEADQTDQSVPTPSAAGADADIRSAVLGLAQTHQVFRLMIEAVKDYGIFLLNPDGYVASWNEGAERIKGYTSDEIIGQHFSVFYPPDALERNWPAYELEEARREGRFEDEGWRVRKDGSRFWANVIITALFREEGNLLGFTKVTRDLSERRAHEDALLQSEQRLEQSNLELSQKNSDLQDFAHVASHDLQEPLRKIRTFAELLEQEYREDLGDNGRLYIDRISASAKRMSTLLHDLLSYSRVTTRAQPFRAVNLNEIVQDAISDLQIMLNEVEGHVRFGRLPTLEADPTQMRQLFQNLIGNALKFHQKGVPPLVTISAESEGSDTAVLHVRDNGIGFEDKYTSRIFAPFQRLHTRREYAGSGLGLAICRRILERHSGSITAESSPGGGATFTLTLPFRQPEEAEETASAPEVPSSPVQ